MPSSNLPILRDILLVGGGHSHVEVLKRFAQRPLPGARLTLICRDTHTPYSAMLPGYIAGHYRYDEVHIDLIQLAQYAGAHFYRDEAIGIDRRNQEVLCRSNAPVAYDLLSINIGSTPQIDQVPGATEHALAVKPIQQFNDRWRELLERIIYRPGRVRIAVVGGGAGGVELILAMQYRLRRECQTLGRDPDDLKFSLFTRSSSILPTHNRRVQAQFERTLNQRAVQVYTHTEVTQVEANQLRSAGGKWYSTDEIVWVTHAGGAPWLKTTGLALDKAGFIQVEDTLQTRTDPHLFAAGDVATQVNHPREKTGVIAVRQGRPLADNLRAAAQGRRLKPYRPQKKRLALITTGDRHAVASRGQLCLAGNGLWHWKNWIDRRFIAKFNELPERDLKAEPQNK